MIKKSLIIFISLAVLNKLHFEAAAASVPNPFQNDLSQYLKLYIYTRDTVDEPVQIDAGLKSLEKAVFNPRNPTTITIHRWLGNYLSLENVYAVRVKLAQEDCNVIVVDWSAVPLATYNEAVANSENLAIAIADVLSTLINLSKGDLENMDMMGYSFGAQVAGMVARSLSEMQKGAKIRKITALDPINQGFNTTMNRLSPNDANFVEVIHTNGGYLGYFEPLGHVDYYPNGGQKQPGCNLNDNTCSSERSYELLPEMWSNNNEFVCLKCFILEQLNDKACVWVRSKMGESEQKQGIYFVETSYAYPYGKGIYFSSFY